MEKIFENMVMNFSQHRDFAKGLPFYGEKGDFNFVMGRSQFTPGISIKQLPLSDLSVNGDVGITDFETYANLIKRVYKRGDRVRAIKVNSMLKEDDDGEQVVGKLDNVDVQYGEEKIRAFIIDPETRKKSEIYPDTLERIFESNSFYAKQGMIPSFDTFAQSL
jgi:hypothetical protein